MGDSMEIHGYKTFHKGLKNRYGKQFLEKGIYTTSERLKFGNNGNGFHFCKRLEDTLRFFPAMEEPVDIAKITALGDVVLSEDDYYGYYDMYCTNKIRIDKVMQRDEIIRMYLHLPDDRVIRFIQGFRLNPEEITLFRVRYGENERIQDAISYYQEGIKDVYENKEKRKLLKRGK